MPLLSQRARDEGLGRGRAASPARFEQRESATIDLIRRMRDPLCGPDERRRLRDRTVRLNLSFAQHHAYGYRQRGEALDDLLQVAALALVKAVDGFDPDRGRSFTGYATPTILGELKRHFRDRVWAVHVPRSLQERCLSVTRARDELTQRLQRPPTVSDIAAELDISPAEVRATDPSASAYRADSLNRPAGADDDSCERLDLLGAEDPAFDALCDRMALRAHIDRLEPRARYVVDRYFYGERTQAQIAEELGTSQMSVSRLLSSALAELRARLSEEAAEPDSRTTARPDATSVRSSVGGNRVVATIRAVRDEVAVAGMRDLPVDVAVGRRRAVECAAPTRGRRAANSDAPGRPRCAPTSDAPARPAAAAPEGRSMAARRTTRPCGPRRDTGRRSRPAPGAGRSASPPRSAGGVGTRLVRHRGRRPRGPCPPWPDHVAGRHRDRSPPPPSRTRRLRMAPLGRGAGAGRDRQARGGLDVPQRRTGGCGVVRPRTRRCRKPLASAAPSPSGSTAAPAMRSGWRPTPTSSATTWVSLALYLPARISRRREVKAVARMLRDPACRRTVDFYLAQRALTLLPLHRLCRATDDPWRDLSEGRLQPLADAELSRLGLSRAGVEVGR